MIARRNSSRQRAPSRCRIDLPVPLVAGELGQGRGDVVRPPIPGVRLSTALRRAWAIGSASVKSISATAAGRTSDGYVRHFALDQRLNSSRGTSSMAMRQACQGLSRSNDPHGLRLEDASDHAVRAVRDVTVKLLEGYVDDGERLHVHPARKENSCTSPVPRTPMDTMESASG